MPRGGRRIGAGRPHGSTEVLSRLEQRALRTIAPTGIRLPDGTPPEHAALADLAMQKICDVMTERVHPAMSPSVLKAAVTVREEICGPVVKKIEAKVGLEQLLSESLEDPS